MSTLATDDKGVIVSCNGCGKSNRIPYGKLNDSGTCGSCGASLQKPSEPVNVTSQSDFDHLIKTSSIPVLVDYWAPWCAPCRMVAPELEKVAANANGRFLVAKVNTEALPIIGSLFNIHSIPTMAVFNNGKEVSRTSGARSAAAIEDYIRQAIAI